MTCAQHERIWLLESEQFSGEQARVLFEHAAGCADCGGALAAIRAARSAGRSHVPVAAPAARARILAAVEGGGDPGIFARWRGPLWVFAGAAAAVAIVEVATLPAPSRGSAPAAVAVVDAKNSAAVEGASVAEASVADAKNSAAPGETAHRARIAVAGGSALLGEGAIAELVPDSELTALSLSSGEITVELEEGRAIEVITADARVKVIGGRTVIAHRRARTGVAVASGTAKAWPKGALTPRVIHAGEKSELAPLEDADFPPPRTGRNLDAALQEAKAALVTDAPRAAVLAERVLVAVPKTTQQEAEALVILADAERRRGRLAASAELYSKVAAHPRGRSFAEEALLQRALILARTDQASEVLATLAIAAEQFPRGATAPERAALAADMYLRKREPLRAAEEIERAASLGRSLKLLERRLEVARALLAEDAELHRARARTLLEALLDPSTPEALRLEAEALMKK